MVIISFFTSILLLILICIFLTYSFVSKYIILNKYKNYIEIYKHFLEIAFDTIYKDQISPFSFNNTQAFSEQLETFERNYIKLCFELMGNKISKMLISFFGSRDTLIINMTMSFRSRIEVDEILKILSDKQAKK